jgi:hypothetical protein
VDDISFFMFVDRPGGVSKKTKNPPPFAGDGFGKFYFVTGLQTQPPIAHNVRGTDLALPDGALRHPIHFGDGWFHCQDAPM